MADRRRGETAALFSRAAFIRFPLVREFAGRKLFVFWRAFRAYHPAGALRAPSTLRLVLGTVAGALAVLSASAAAAAGGEYDDLYAAAAARRRKAAMDAAWGALLRLPYTRKRVEELQQELDAAADEAARRHVERTFVREVDEDDDEGDEWVAALGDNNEDEDEDDAEVDL